MKLTILGAGTCVLTPTRACSGYWIESGSEAGARRLIPMHFYFDPDEERLAERLATGYGGEITVARDGLTIESSLLPRRVQDVQHAEDLAAVAHHQTVAGMPPAQRALAVDDERRSVGHVAIFVVHAVGADHRAVHVAQKRERETSGLGEFGVAEGRVGADGEHHRPALARPLGDLIQAAQLGRSDAAEVVAVEDQDDVAALE